MIYLLASASYKDDLFKLKRLFLVSDNLGSFSIDFANNNTVSSTSMSKKDIVAIWKSQKYNVSSVFYGNLRQIEGEHSDIAVQLIAKQLEELRSIKDYDITVFKTINNYGVDYAE